MTSAIMRRLRGCKVMNRPLVYESFINMLKSEFMYARVVAPRRCARDSDSAFTWV